MKNSNSRISVVLILVVSFGIGCNSKKPTREDAGFFIKGTFLAEGEVVDDLKMVTEEQDLSKFEALAQEGVIQYSKQQAFITLPNGKKILSKAGWLLDIGMTKEGEKYAKGINSTLEESSVQYVTVKLAKKEFLEVTGIRFLEGDRQGIAEYTWRYVNITPFGKHWGEELGGSAWKDKRISTDEIHADSVQMLLYDDGWRMFNKKDQLN